MSLQELVEHFGKAGTTADAVYSTLRHCIVEGDLAPGERLRSDALAKRLGVSRTPVREALRKLESDGLVVASPRQGLVVRQLSENDLAEVFFVREILEGAAAGLAAENATPSELTQIRELLEDMEAVNKDGNVEMLRQLTGEFHLLIARAGHNRHLADLLAGLQDSIRQFQSSTLFTTGRPADALDEHRGLLKALEARDASRAEQLARQHRRKTLDMRRRMIRGQLRQERSKPSGSVPKPV